MNLSRPAADFSQGHGKRGIPRRRSSVTSHKWISKLNAEIATAAASEAPGMKIDSASIDLWTYKDSYQLAKVEIKGASSSIGSLGISITVTNYGAPVTITAPAASDVQVPTT